MVISLKRKTIAAPRPIPKEAFAYLKTVKDKFQDGGETYAKLIEVLIAYKDRRVDVGGLRSEVQKLFKGHKDLLLSFNTFLPNGYKISTRRDRTPPKKSVEYRDAIQFVNKVKARFEDDDQPYKSFLETLVMFRQDKKSIAEVHQEVTVLFRDHNDLLLEFHQFLPCRE